MLDFVDQLLLTIRGLNPLSRWKLRAGLAKDGDANISKEHLQSARLMLFETLPILVYIEEIRAQTRKEISVNAEKHRPQQLPSSRYAYRELFCPKDDRHHTLRRDIMKFDDRKYSMFRSLVLDELWSRDNNGSSAADRQTQVFQLIYKQLKDFAAFPVGESAERVLQQSSGHEESDLLSGQSELLTSRKREAHARWVCVQRVVQAVEPGLFPYEMPKPQNGSSFQSTRNASGKSEALGRLGLDAHS